jgi:hypothetical protein
MRHDQRMLGIHRGLYVIGRSERAGHAHEACFRLRMLLQLLQRRLHGRWIDGGLLLLVRLLHAVQILLQCLAFAHAAGARYSTELAAIHRNPLAPDQPTGSREPDQLRSCRRHRIAMHPPELGDGLVVRIQPPQKPHQLHVAAALRLQPPRRTQLMQVTVQIQLQQVARIVAGTPCLGRFRTLEPKFRHRQTIDERVDHPAHMIGWNKIVQNYRKQRPLMPPFTLDIAHK